MSTTPSHPPQRFETERLVLRVASDTDAAAINVAIHASWPELSIWMDWAQGGPPTLAETLARIADHTAEFEARTEFLFAAFEKASGAFAGMTSLLDLDWDVPKGEVGYWLATSKVGHGFASEAARAMATLGRSLGLVRVQLCCDAKNTRSRAVAIRAGFTFEGILKNERRNPQGGLRDTCMFAVLG